MLYVLEKKGEQMAKYRFVSSGGSLIEEKESTLDKFKLEGKICLITGGAGFLGPKHAEAILDGGGFPVLVDIDEDALKRTFKKLSKKYPNCFTCRIFDITCPEIVKKSVKEISLEIGPISILINNAAINHPATSNLRLENFPMDVWWNDINVGLTGAMLMSKEVGKQMVKYDGGVILNVASDLGVVAPDQRIYQKEHLVSELQPVKPVTYSVVKHGLIGLTKYLATYWADKGVRVNSISPGGVYDYQGKSFVSKVSNLIPLGRMANADEYKAAILFLCSDASSYMTGTNLVIDGGRTCW